MFKWFKYITKSLHMCHCSVALQEHTSIQVNTLHKIYPHGYGENSLIPLPMCVILLSGGSTETCLTHMPF